MYAPLFRLPRALHSNEIARFRMDTNLNIASCKGGMRSRKSPLKNGLERHKDVPPNFTGSQKARKFVRLTKVPLANRWLQKPGTAFATDW
jgi:hypothetical protein